MALEALSLNDSSSNWPKLDDDDIPARNTDTLDIDDDEDEDNDRPMYYYNNRYGNEKDEMVTETGFADFGETNFDAAFADFSSNTNQASDAPAFEANFDTVTDNFAAFPDSSFPTTWEPSPATTGTTSSPSHSHYLF